ncbi:MAG: flagellar export chaperone FlgN [Planctomycetota bacterium]|jgi:hypothetical protein
MKPAAIEIEDKDEILQRAAKLEPDKIDELLAVLDEDIKHIQDSLLRLDELRSLLIKPSNESLDSLLESIRADSDGYAVNESKRQSIQRELAAELGFGVGQMNLSRIEAHLMGQKKDQVISKKIKLRSLTEELRKEHLSTAMLLSDCARFNGLLLRTIFDFGKTGTVYYNSNGSTKRQSGTAFVNLQF